MWLVVSLFVWYVCLYEHWVIIFVHVVDMQLHICMWVHTCGHTKLISAVFLHHSPLVIWRKLSYWAQSFTVLARVANQFVLGISLSLSWVLRLPMATIPYQLPPSLPSFYLGSVDLKSSLHEVLHRLNSLLSPVTLCLLRNSLEVWYLLNRFNNKSLIVLPWFYLIRFENRHRSK